MVKAADELSAVVGLPDQVAKTDATALEMLLYASGKDGAGGGGAALGKSPEQQSTAHVASGVFHDGKVESLRLGPVVRDVVEVFGIGRDLLKDAPSGLDVSQVLLALIFSAAFVQQAVLTPDTLQGTVAEREIELADETASPEGGQLLAQGDPLLLDFWGGFAGLMVGGAGECDEAARPLLLIAAQPFAHGGDRGLEQASRRLNATLARRVYEPQAMVIGVSHFSHQGEVRRGHGWECSR